MKKCKFCQSEIDSKARVCPVCRREIKGNPLKLFILLFIFVVLLPIACEINSDLTNQNGDNNKYITLDEFSEIEMGMTYEEVKNIIGSEGTIVSQTDLDGYSNIMYMWYSSNNISNANFSFQNGYLINKAQVGLN